MENYKGFELSSVGDKNWGKREITLFKAIIDRVATADGGTLVTSHHHDELYRTNNDYSVIKCGANETVFNDRGDDRDLRVEGDTDANLLFVDAGNDRIGIGTNAPGALLDVRGAAVFNEGGGDYDFRIEGDGEQNLFFVDAGNDRVGIGTATPSCELDVNGSFQIGSDATVTGIKTSIQDNNTTLATGAAIIAVINSYIDAAISGTAGYIPKFAFGGNDVVDSVMQEDSSNIGIGVTPLQKFHVQTSSGVQSRYSYDASDYADFTVGATGTLTIATTGDPGAANIVLSPDGIVNVTTPLTVDGEALFDGLFKIKERAAAGDDTDAYGQLWVKNTAPCQLWYTDDAGNDTQIV